MFVVLLSCNSKGLFDNKEIVVTVFPETHELKGDSIQLDVLGCVDLYCVDTFLIAYTPMSEKGYFHVFSTSDFELLGSFIPIGRGPNEFYAVNYSSAYKTDDGQVKAWLSNDVMNYEWNITQSVKQKQTVIDTAYKLQGVLSDGVWLPGRDNLMFGFIKRNNNVEYTRYDLKTKKVINANKMFSRDLATDKIATASMPPCLKPDNSKVANIGWWTNCICIFNADFSDMKIVAIYHKPESIDQISATEREERILYYSCSDATDQYVYALYVNQPEKDRRYHFGYEEIHIFDWNANPVAKFIIRENIMFFRVDAYRKCLYGLTSDEKVYRYDVSSYLKEL